MKQVPFVVKYSVRDLDLTLFIFKQLGCEIRQGPGCHFVRYPGLRDDGDEPFDLCIPCRPPRGASGDWRRRFQERMHILMCGRRNSSGQEQEGEFWFFVDQIKKLNDKKVK